MNSLSGNGNGNGNEATTQLACLLACLLACSESYLVLNIYTLAMFGDNSVNFKPCLVQSSDGHSLLYFTLLCSALLCLVQRGLCRERGKLQVIGDDATKVSTRQHGIKADAILQKITVLSLALGGTWQTILR